MPTVEIISLNAASLDLREEDFTIAIIEEPHLVSHRGLFDDYLQQRKGIIVHLGNPCCKEDKSFFFAGELMDWSNEPETLVLPQVGDGPDADPDWGAGQVELFRFLPRFKGEVDTILQKAILASPVDTALFLTDIQLGPAKGSIAEAMPRRNFWKRHDAGNLSFNTLYTITPE